MRPLAVVAVAAAVAGWTAARAKAQARNYADATAFFDNDADNLRMMHAKGWIDDGELVEMLGDTRSSGGPPGQVDADAAVAATATTTTATTAANVWPLEQVQCSIGRYTALPCGRRAGRTEPLGRHRTEAQLCATWNSMCDPAALKLLQIAIPKAASTSLDNVLRRSPLIDPCYVPLCCDAGGGGDGGTIMQQLDYEQSPKHEIQYMTNKQQLKQTLGVACSVPPGHCDTVWSLSTKYQQPCNYVSAHSSYDDALVAMDRGVANVQVVTMLREPVARVRSAFLYTAKRDWGSGKHKLGTHAHPEDMDIVDFMEMNTLYAGNNLQTRLVAGSRNQTADAGTLQRAKQHLADMAFFGIAERFDDSVCLLRHSAFGRDVLRINDGWPNGGNDDGPLTEANVRTSMYKRLGLNLSDEQLQKARASPLLQLDLELYAFAQRLFDERFAASPECVSEAAARAGSSSRTPTATADAGEGSGGSVGGGGRGRRGGRRRDSGGGDGGSGGGGRSGASRDSPSRTSASAPVPPTPTPSKLPPASAVLPQTDGAGEAPKVPKQPKKTIGKKKKKKKKQRTTHDEL